MPNWCNNELVVSGPKREVAKFLSVVDSKKNDKDCHLRFGALVPLPKALKGTTAPSNVLQPEAILTLVKRLCDEAEAAGKPKLSDAAIKKAVREHGITEAEHDKRIKKYGAVDWYDWQVKNWGTKWELSETCDWYVAGSGERATVVFSTAWSPPCAWIEKASVKFPKLRFDLKFCEGGCAFVGRHCVKSGMLEADTNYGWDSKDGKRIRARLNGEED